MAKYGWPPSTYKHTPGNPIVLDRLDLFDDQGRLLGSWDLQATVLNPGDHFQMKIDFYHDPNLNKP